jgi:hypothetical protein
MEKFKKIIENEKKKIYLDDENIIHKLFNYILNDILDDYKISYVFYNLLNSKKKFDEETILQLSLVINIYSILIDIIYNLPFFLNNKLTNSNLSIHEVFNETITILGLMFSVNHLMSLHIKILDKLNINKIDIMNNIFPFMNENFEIFNEKINDEEINTLLNDNAQERKIILEKLKKEKKEQFIRIILKYLELLDNRITFTEENLIFFKSEINKKYIDISKFKTIFNLN